MQQSSQTIHQHNQQLIPDPDLSLASIYKHIYKFRQVVFGSQTRFVKEFRQVVVGSQTNCFLEADLKIDNQTLQMLFVVFLKAGM